MLFSKYYYYDKIKADESGRTCSTIESDERFFRNFSLKTKSRENLLDRGVDVG